MLWIPEHPPVPPSWCGSQSIPQCHHHTVDPRASLRHPHPAVQPGVGPQQPLWLPSPACIFSQLFQTEPTQTMGSPSSPRNRLWRVERGQQARSGTGAPSPRKIPRLHPFPIPSGSHLVDFGQHSHDVASQDLTSLVEDVTTEWVPSLGTWGWGGSRMGIWDPPTPLLQLPQSSPVAHLPPSPSEEGKGYLGQRACQGQRSGPGRGHGEGDSKGVGMGSPNHPQGSPQPPHTALCPLCTIPSASFWQKPANLDFSKVR